LATCKPNIRISACTGDLILGTGSAARNLAGHAVFLMRIDKIISFDEYWNDPQYARRVPVMNGSLQQRFGDNIYHRANGKWVQADSRHTRVNAKPNVQNLRRDTAKTDRVLVGSEFVYWGGDGPVVPKSLSKFVHKSPGHRGFFSTKDIARFLAWMGKFEGKGMIGDPVEWRFEKYWR
jgi:hypothetical protein